MSEYNDIDALTGGKAIEVHPFTNKNGQNQTCE